MTGPPTTTRDERGARRLILFMGVSLDGYVAGPNGEHDWRLPPEDEELVGWKVGLLSAADAG